MAGRNDHFRQRIRRMTPNDFIDRIAAISAVGREPADHPVNLFEEVIDLARIAGVLVSQNMSHDHAAVRV